MLVMGSRELVRRTCGDLPFQRIVSLIQEIVRDELARVIRVLPRSLGAHLPPRSHNLGSPATRKSSIRSPRAGEPSNRASRRGLFCRRPAWLQDSGNQPGSVRQGSRLEPHAASHCSQGGEAVALPCPIESDWAWAREQGNGPIRGGPRMTSMCSLSGIVES